MSAAKARFTVVFATKRLLLKEQLWSLTNVSSKGVTIMTCAARSAAARGRARRGARA